MTSLIRTVVPMLMVMGTVACSSMPESQATVDARSGPQFTQEQKDAMTTDEKVALYNEEVREEDEIVCRRERSVGSRMNRTRCFSRSEREANQDESQEALRRMQNSYLGNRETN